MASQHADIAITGPLAANTDTASGTDLSLPGYALREEIGRGGMGVVYRARDLRLDRDVAVKLLQADVPADSPAAVRFRTEAQITGRLQHPGIPAVHELGTLPDGGPFLAMKLVGGRTLQELLKERVEPGQDRGRLLAVFEQVCHAVGYAHAHGVIHRDLKPANVMVGAFGEVQVMDWGLAKILGESPARDPAEGKLWAEAGPTANPGQTIDHVPAETSTDRTTDHVPAEGSTVDRTRAGQVMGTPAYMPPEQARGELALVDRRADVFSLGAILCTVLTGLPPYSGRDGTEVLRKASAGELGEALARLDACGAEPELVALCKQCLAVQKEDRPTDGAAVAGEVTRIRQAAEERARQAELERAEVLVRAAEQSKRRRIWLGLAATLLVGLVASSALAVWANQARRDAEAARISESRRLAQIEKGVELLAGMVRGINPREEEQDKPLYEQLRERAETAADTLDAESVGDSRAVARLQTILGETLITLGNSAKAVEVLQKARAIRERELGEEHPDTLITLSNLAEAYYSVGRRLEAIELHERVRDARMKTLGAEHNDTLVTLTNLAVAYQVAGRLPEAIKLGEQVRDARVKTLGAEHKDTLVTLNSLAQVYRAAGRLPQAIELYEQVRYARVKKLGAEHPYTLATISSLAQAYHDVRKLPQAIELSEQVRDARVKKLGAEHPYTLTSFNNLASLYHAAGKLPQAIELYEQVRDARVKKHGAEHPDTLRTLNNLAVAYRSAGKLPQAIEITEQVRDAMVKKLGAEHPDTLTTLNNLAIAYHDAGRLPEAIKLLEQVRDVRVKKSGAEHPDTLNLLGNLGRMYHTAGRQAESLTTLEQAALGIEQRQFLHPKADGIIPNTAAAYEEAGQYDRAEAWRRKWLAYTKEKAKADSPVHTSALAGLGSTLLRQGKWVEAETVLKPSLSIREKQQPEAWTTFYTRSMFGAALLGQKKYADAAPLLLNGYEGLKKQQAKIPATVKALYLTDALDRLVKLAEAQGNPDEAAKWRKERQAIKPK